jgi:hypothetical protein
MNKTKEIKQKKQTFVIIKSKKALYEKTTNRNTNI